MESARIVIVEDELIIAMEMEDILESYGYEVVARFASGEEVVTAEFSPPPDVILMDVNLGASMDGTVAARELRSRYNVPVIYVSAYSDEETVRRAKLSDAFGYITKPFNPRDLYTTIEMALYKHQTQQKERAHEALLSTTLSAIEDCVITTGPRGEVRLVNPAAERFLNISQDQTRGRPVHEMLHFAACEDGRALSLSEVVAAQGDRSSPVMCLVHSLGADRSIPAEVTCLPVDEAGNGVSSSSARGGMVICVRDRSETFQAEAVRSLLASVVSSSDDAIIVLAPDGAVRNWNAGAERIFGYRAEEVLGQPISILTPSYQIDEIPGFLQSVFENKRATQFETIRQHKDGSVRDVACTLSPVISDRGAIRGISLIARDITQARRMQREVIEISENERVRLGQDLHDSLGQQLTGVLLKARALDSMVERSAEEGLVRRAVQDNTSELVVLIEEAIRESRSIARGLSPLTLADQGLSAAIEELAGGVVTTNGVRIDCDVADLDAVPGTGLGRMREVQIYRIIQEALSNACRHGRASRVRIWARADESELRIDVRDNGRGFGGGETKSGSGLGLKIMRYRAGMIGGILEIRSEMAVGTSVMFRLPLSKGATKT